MRCLSCHYSLKNLPSGGEHRCPECGRVFDPDDPNTFDWKRLRSWPALLCIAVIGVGVALKGFLANLFPLLPPRDAPLFLQGASALFDGCLEAAWVVLLLLFGFALGRWQYRR